MTDFFANPAALWAGLLILPLLVLFMLRHRPVKLRVPSTLLWQGVANAQVATSPFQMLRRSLSLLLMLLALLALVLALAGFRIPGGETVQAPLVLVVDVTASMAAREGNRTRLDIAVERAEAIAGSAGNAEVTILAYDGALRPVPAASAADALGQLQTTQRGAAQLGLTHALRAAAESEPGKRFVLFSDTAPGAMPANATFVPVGSPRANAGIVAAGVTEQAGGRADVFVGIEYAGGEPLRSSVLLERIEGGNAELVDARDVDLRPGVRTPVTFPGVSDGLYRARLRLEDALGLDDVAYIRFAALRPLVVVLPAQCPATVRKVCEAIAEGMGAITLSPSESPDAAYVFAAEASAGVSSRLPAVYLGPLAAPAGVTFGDSADLEAGDTRPVQSPLWRGAGNPIANLTRTRMIRTDLMLRPLLEAADGVPLATVVRANGVEDLVVGFDPDKDAEGFTSRYEWLILWANWFEYVRRIREPLPNGAFSTRDALRVTELEGRGAYRIKPKDGDWIECEPGRPVSLDRAGVYEVAGIEGLSVREFGASLLDPAETALGGPGAEYDEAALEEWLREFEGGGTRALELRPWLALLAAALLLFDWFWFRRRFPLHAEAPRRGVTTVRTR
jgi:hypothetical protein